MDKRPNILFLMTDQQRFDALSCMNNEIVTPNLDRLISESVYFIEARCVNPSCVPSRAAIVTGKYPSQCGCPMYITKLPKDETTFMSLLQKNGYYTAVVGKQHFADSEIEKGYDYENIVDGHGTFAPREALGGYIDFLTDNGVDPATVSKNAFISGAEWKADTKYHIDEYIGELGKGWLTDCAPTLDKPWFFTLSFSGPHHPYDGIGTEYERLYDDMDLSYPETSYDDLDDKPKQYKEMDGYSHIYLKDFTKEDYIKTKKSYYANMSMIDAKIGEVIEILKKQGMYDNTVIIFTSDHGDFMGDYGLVEKLQCLSDSLMRVPLFVKPPIAGFKGVKINDLVTNIDIASTCLEVAGADIPSNIECHPYSRYWNDTEPIIKQNSLYLEAGAIKGCIIDNYKIVHYMNRDYGELYDLKNDSLEIKNLWDISGYDDIKLKGYKFMLNEMYKATPQHNVPWNIGTPEI